jgi:hypothetical protein
VLVAAVTFSLLTAAAATGQARAVGVLRSSLCPAYDILVRPPGKRSAAEESRGLVADNYLPRIYGAITMAHQYEKIKHLPAVAAAPIEVLGYVLATARIPVDVTSALGGRGGAVATVASRLAAADNSQSSSAAGSGKPAAGTQAIAYAAERADGSEASATYAPMLTRGEQHG